MPLSEIYHYGFAGEIGAHRLERELPTANRPESGGGVLTAPLADDEILEFGDSRTYTLKIEQGSTITNAAVQSNDQRPYVLVTNSGSGMENDAANLVPEPPASGETRTFRVEGVWMGSADDVDADPNTDELYDFFIDRGSPPPSGFDWDEIVIKSSTFDPGGRRGDGTTILPLRIRTLARIRRLVIDKSIVGPILIQQMADCSESGFVDELVIRDSIVDAGPFNELIGPANAIDCVTGRVLLERSTVIGNVDVAVIEASDSIIMGTLTALDQHRSCLRFSAVSPGGVLPRLFEVFGPARPSENIPPTPIVSTFFTSLRFGDPGYALLSVVAPIEISEGAENGSEMGAFSSLLRPIRMKSIIAKVDEFKPAGVIAQYILQGENAPFPREDEETP
jgi:hypothetical protein